MSIAKFLMEAFFCTLIVGAGAGAGTAAAADAEDSPGAVSSHESLEEAWWTGPLLAANAATLPQGHLLVEPYLYDALPYAHFDSHGIARDVSHANDFGSQSYVNYVSGRVNIEDASVYGTTAGFHGHAAPGDTAVADLAFEYSATRHWVLALDLWYERDGATTVFGSGLPNGIELRPAPQSNSGVGRLLYVAPAVEYNWTSRVGVIFGFRLAAVGWNENATITPVMAINWVI